MYKLARLWKADINEFIKSCWQYGEESIGVKVYTCLDLGSAAIVLVFAPKRAKTPRLNNSESWVLLRAF